MVSRIARSYRIVAVYHTLNEQGSKTVTPMNVCLSMPDLAVLLHTLDASPAVASISVFSMPTLLSTNNLSKLTGDDIGITDLEKLL